VGQMVTMSMDLEKRGFGNWVKFHFSVFFSLRARVAVFFVCLFVCLCWMSSLSSSFDPPGEAGPPFDRSFSRASSDPRFGSFAPSSEFDSRVDDTVLAAQAAEDARGAVRQAAQAHARELVATVLDNLREVAASLEEDDWMFEAGRRR
jgi:hypothetical protein